MLNRENEDILGKPFVEIFSIFPYPFERGKIPHLWFPNVLSNLEIGCFSIILIIIFPPLLLLAILYVIMPNFALFKGLKWIYHNNKFINAGLDEFNSNYNFKVAKEDFIAAKENFEAGIFFPKGQQPMLTKINEVIIDCMGYLEQYDELYTFVQNNDVLYKRTKLFLLSCITKSQEETISYFETNYPEEELKKHPAYLILPLLAIAIFYNDTQKALQYLEDRYSYVYNQWMNDELYVLTAVKIEFYQQLGDTDNTNKLKDSLLDYEKTLSTDYVASEFIKAIPILQRNRNNKCN